MKTLDLGGGVSLQPRFYTKQCVRQGPYAAIMTTEVAVRVMAKSRKVKRRMMCLMLIVCWWLH